LPVTVGGPSVVLRTLFEEGLHFDNVDPARRLLSAFDLVLRVLADDGDSLPVGWMPVVIPQILTPLTIFFRHLEPVHKVQLVQRLVSLDRGVLGLGEFLVQGEVQRLAGLLKVMAERGVITIGVGNHHDRLTRSQPLLKTSWNDFRAVG
jgi:hypothetical protein